MTEFKLNSEYSPAGGQPQAINALISNLENNIKNPHIYIRNDANMGHSTKQPKILYRLILTESAFIRTFKL